MLPLRLFYFVFVLVHVLKNVPTLTCVRHMSTQYRRSALEKRRHENKKEEVVCATEREMRDELLKYLLFCVPNCLLLMAAVYLGITPTCKGK